MSLKPLIRTGPLPPTTQQAIWGHSSWVRLRARSLLMEVAIGGRHTVVGASTIRTRRRTAALTGGMVIILTRRLTTITTRELTAGKPVLTVRTARPLPGLVTIHTPGRTLEALRSRHLMGAEAQHRPIIRTPGPMPKPGKVPVRTLNGAARMFRGETKAPQWAIIRPRMERGRARRLRREERRPLPARSGETQQSARLPAATCMLDMRATSIRTPGTGGRNTTTEGGIR